MYKSSFVVSNWAILEQVQLIASKLRFWQQKLHSLILGRLYHMVGMFVYYSMVFSHPYVRHSLIGILDSCRLGGNLFFYVMYWLSCQHFCYKFFLPQKLFFSIWIGFVMDFYGTDLAWIPVYIGLHRKSFVSLLRKVALVSVLLRMSLQLFLTKYCGDFA